MGFSAVLCAGLAVLCVIAFRRILSEYTVPGLVTDRLPVPVRMAQPGGHSGGLHAGARAWALGSQ